MQGGEGTAIRRPVCRAEGAGPQAIPAILPSGAAPVVDDSHGSGSRDRLLPLRE